MAKKKGNTNRIVAGIIGVVVILVVVVPVLFFIFGIGNEDVQVLPQDTAPELEVPFVEPVLTVDEIDELIEETIETCDIDQSVLQQIAECEILTADEDEVPFDPNAPADPCSQVNRDSLLQCNEEIDLLILKINALEEQIPEDNPNGTETSIDDPFTQICDQTPELIVCGDSRSLELITTVLKTDSAGVQTTVETTTGIPQLSFFIEDISDIDFQNGQLQFSVQVKGDPNLSYLGTGKVDLLIGDQSVLTEIVNVRVDGTADEEGKVDLLFISPTGIPSSLILFDFADNFDTFPDESITPVRLNVIELNIAGERDQDFALIDTDVFTMDIARDDIKLLITDEEGIVTRVYPSDSTLIVTGRTSTSEPSAPIGTTRIQTFDSIFLGNGRGCTTFQLISDRSFTPTTTGTTTVPAPTLSGITLSSIDPSTSETITLSRSTSGTQHSWNDLTRNQNYTIMVGGLTSIPLDYGKSQETKSYTCTQEGIPIVSSTSKLSGNTSNCGYYTVSTWKFISGVTVTPNSLSCTFPQETP